MSRILAIGLGLAVVIGGAAAAFAMRDAGTPSVIEAAEAGERSTPMAGADSRTAQAEITDPAKLKDALLEPQPLPDIALGPDDAPVTIIEYASLTCTHCSHFHAESFPTLKKDYIDTGKVRFIMREFPLDSIAAYGFMLARCTPMKRYEVIDAFFKQQSSLFKMKSEQEYENWLLGFAKEVGFNDQTALSCLTDQKLLQQVKDVASNAQTKFGVSSTPTFFINGKIVRGAMSVDELKQEIDPLLKS